MSKNDNGSFTALSMIMATERGLQLYSNLELFSTRYMKILKHICKGAIRKMENTNSQVRLFKLSYKEQTSIANQSVGIPLDNHAIGRKAIIVQKIRNAIKNEGIKQVVVLGGGFDPRLLEEALNNEILDENIQFFEIDKGHTFTIKNKIINAIKQVEGFDIPTNYHALQGDFSSENLIDILDSKLDTSKPTLFIAEGVTTYLDEERLTHLFNQIKDLGPLHQFLVSFTPGEFEKSDMEKDGMLKAGEKHTTHVARKELVDYSNSHGFTVIGQFSHMDIHKNMAALINKTAQKPPRNKKENYVLLSTERCNQSTDIELIPRMKEIEAIKAFVALPEHKSESLFI